MTAEERRGAVLLIVLVVAGAGWDLLRTARIAGPAAGHLPADSIAAPLVAAIPDTAPAPSRSRPSPAAPAVRAVDLNRAGESDLDALPGIGPVLARRIVEHRATAGPFRTVDELRAVRGVGPRLMEKLRPYVRV